MKRRHTQPAIIFPESTLKVMTVLLRAFLIVDGLTSFSVSVLGRRKGLQGGTLLLEGLAGIIIGVLTFIWPGVGVVAIVWMIGVYATGVWFGDGLSCLRMIIKIGRAY